MNKEEYKALRSKSAVELASIANGNEYSSIERNIAKEILEKRKSKAQEIRNKALLEIPFVRHLKHFGLWLAIFVLAIGSNFGTQIFIGGPDGEDVFNIIIVFFVRLACWGLAFVFPIFSIVIANAEEDFFGEESWNVPFPFIIRAILTLASLSSYLVLANIYNLNLLEKLFG